MLHLSFCIFFSLFIVSVFPFPFNVTSSQEKVDYQVLINATRSIMDKCQLVERQFTLLLGGDYNEFLEQIIFQRGIPVGLIAETSTRFNTYEKYTWTKYIFKMYNSYNYIHFLGKAHYFIFVASSQPILQSIIQRSKDSPWANSDGFYILVDRQTESRGCRNAHIYLWTAWKYDLLSVIFLCIDPNDGIVLYTYNPYTNSTPPLWQEVGRAKGRKGHPFVIMKTRFDKILDGNTTCNDLDFDKTTNLNGYEIRLNAVEIKPYLKINLTASDLERFCGENSEIIQTVSLKLGAKTSINVLKNGSGYDLGGIGPNGTFVNLMAPVSDGKIDIGMNSRPLYVLWKIRYTYPHTRSGLCVFTQSNQEVSEFTKILTFMSPEVLAGMIIICLIIYAVFTKNEGYIKAGLQVIRLMVCVGVLRPSKVNSTRIFICMVLILFLNVNALFQGHLSSLLTVPVYYSNIDTIENLKKSGYTIYGMSYMRNFLIDPVLKSRFVSTTYNKCKEHVENSSTAVCMSDCYHMYYRIKNQDFIKSDMLIPITQSYITREDWPLFNRVDYILQMMTEAGLIFKARINNVLHIKREWKKKKAIKKDYKVMLLKQLTFAFYILGAGYVCATIVFVLELVVDKSAFRSWEWKRKGKNKKKEKQKVGINS